MNAKGDASEIIVWLAVVLVVFIGASWLVTSFLVKTPSLELINNDLASLQFMIDDACLAEEYNYFFNPSVEEGALILSGKEICVTSKGLQACRETICDLVYKEIDLGKTIKLNIIKQGEKILVNNIE